MDSKTVCSSVCCVANLDSRDIEKLSHCSNPMLSKVDSLRKASTSHYTGRRQVGPAAISTSRDVGYSIAAFHRVNWHHHELYCATKPHGNIQCVVNIGQLSLQSAGNSLTQPSIYQPITVFSSHCPAAWSLSPFSLSTQVESVWSLSN